MFPFERNMENNKIPVLSSKRRQTFLSPPVCMGYPYSPIAQLEDFLCAWRIKLSKQAFVLKVEFLQNIQTERREM